MKIENSLGLPEPVYRAICNDSYERGDSDYTTSELILPVRILSLRRKWQEHITEDAVNRVWSLWGQILHSVFERAAMGDELVEKRFYIQRQGFRIGGRVDLLHKTTLIDYKETKVFKTGKPKQDWINQANVNRLLCVANGFPVERIEYWARYRDWDKKRAGFDAEYPTPMQKFLIPIWTLPEAEAYVRERIAAHEVGKENPPVCTPEERWRKPDQWALMKKGAKRATKLYDTQKQAYAAEGMTPQCSHHYVEPRPGEDTRCLHYCNVNKYCSYFQSLMQDKVA